MGIFKIKQKILWQEPHMSWASFPLLKSNLMIAQSSAWVAIRSESGIKEAQNQSVRHHSFHEFLAMF